LTDQHIKISVIIVNYNVEYFLEQCLNSTFKALEKVNGEVYVVDNNSIDGSVEMVREKFPQVHLIANKENTGFSKANNQAMRIAKGEYVLLLNPDTVVEEDTFIKCIDFMDSHPEAGGLGVRMVDGKGIFLPESKRGLPTPAAAFFKIFGISRLFPKSRRFSKYHLGYLNEFETNEIDVLSGAFMLMRKETLDKVGLLDEAFFMYGEDIDLSYRILLGGYKNYYFPETKIIHYKGESTKKSSVNYVFVFYNAMVIFAKKHFSQKNAKLFSFLINMAIYFRAGLAILSRVVKKSFLPLIDITVNLTLLVSLTKIWEKEHIEFPQEILIYALPAYLFIWLISILYNGGYDKPIKLISYFKGVFIGTGFILIIYALLPKDFQFSRLYILAGAMAIFTYFIISRFILSSVVGGKFDLSDIKSKTFGIVGSAAEVERVKAILKNSSQRVEKVFSISPNDEKQHQDIGTLSQLDQIVHIHKTDEIIFCAKDTSAESIINWMVAIDDKDVDFKIAQPDSLFLIGSNSIDTAGDLYVLDINAIAQPKNRRNKRTLDFLIGFFGISLFPVLFLLYKKPIKFFQNLIQLILGKKTLVGYKTESINDSLKLPKIKSGILTPLDFKPYSSTINKSERHHKMNLIYARDYSVIKDLQLLLQNLRELDR
jgi:GT2 family glycosyltransferase